MANIEGEWEIHSRAKKPTSNGRPNRIYSAKTWTISQNGRGWEALWWFQDEEDSLLNELPGSDGGSFIFHNGYKDCTVRAWLITNSLMVGIATKYEATDERHCKDGPVSDDDIDVFVAMRKGPADYTEATARPDR
ncbi:MAG: hypothetical protein JF614_08910 [Acidobacteria bacterium]|nr:hypothetical protein [Acidobacteriota bacterium]